jgi:hypothetical protein
MLSRIQSRITNRLLTTGFRAAFTMTDSHIHAIHRAPVCSTSGASVAMERGVAAACNIQPS